MSLRQVVLDQAKLNEEYYESLETGGDTSTTAPATPDEKKVEDDGLYEKRFKNFKASADKTIHEQRQELAKLNGLAEQNSLMSQQLNELQAEKPKFTKEALDTFSNEELQVFNNMLDERTSGLNSEVDTLRVKLATLENDKATESTNNEHLLMKNQVAAAVPNFEKIDVSVEFKEWLDGVDGYGKSRKDSLREAQATKNIASIVAYYNDFNQQQKPATVDPRTLQQTPNSTSSDPQQTQPTSGKVWGQAEIQEFYKDSGLGKFTPEQKQKIEQEIQKQYYG